MVSSEVAGAVPGSSPEKRLTGPGPSHRIGRTRLRVEPCAEFGNHPMEVRAMAWEAPEFVEVRMDAEINSYQDDFDREQDDRF
jgi:coenzyme PQQ precursor peptide PqqA